MKISARVTIAAALGAAVLAVSAPAYAAPNQDFQNCFPGFFSGSCTSVTIPSNSVGHFVTVSFHTPAINRNSPSHWYVRDVDTGVRVGSGVAWSTQTPYERTIGGLYGRYQLVMYNSSYPSDGAIRNF